MELCSQFGFVLLLAVGLTPVHRASGADEGFDVVIAGGSTAAFAASVASAGQGARTCLVEPTDWVGGQLTASAVPAVDEAWHKIVDPRTRQVVLNVASIARDRVNMTPSFRAMLDATGNPGRGWVSNYCFEPRKFLEQQLLPLERRHDKNLVVYRNTVIKRVAVSGEGADRRIKSIQAIRRTPRAGVAWGGYDRLPSLDLPDWYSAEPSPRFSKEVVNIPAHCADRVHRRHRLGRGAGGFRCEVLARGRERGWRPRR